MAEDKAVSIRKQVEYYFSDANLKKDKFFQDKMRADPENFLPMEVLLKCNKLKALTSDPKEVAAALAGHEELVVKDDATAIKRKAPLPDLDEAAIAQKGRKRTNSGSEGTAQKKRKLESGEEESKEEEEEETEEAVKPCEVFHVTEVPANANWAMLKDAFKAALGAGFTVFVDQTAKGATVLVNGEDVSTVPAKIESGVTVGETKLAIVREENAEEKLKIVRKLRPAKPLKQGKKGKNKRETKKQRTDSKQAGGPVTVGERRFDNRNQLKSTLRDMLHAHADGEVLPENEKTLLKEVLSHHEKATEKMANLKDFTVGPHPEHPEARCFLVVKEDGSKMDFSYMKCCDKL